MLKDGIVGRVESHCGRVELMLCGTYTLEQGRLTLFILYAEADDSHVTQRAPPHTQRGVCEYVSWQVCMEVKEPPWVLIGCLPE